MSSYDVIDKITVPSLFYYAIDDPVIQTNSIAFDLLRNNQNVTLVTTECGSHLCGLYSIIENEQWFVDLAVEWFANLLKQPVPAKKQLSLWDSDSESD